MAIELQVAPESNPRQSVALICLLEGSTYDVLLEFKGYEDLDEQIRLARLEGKNVVGYVVK